VDVLDGGFYVFSRFASLMPACFRSKSFAVFAFTALLAGLTLRASSGGGQPAPFQLDNRPHLAALQPVPLFSDLDGDHQLDQAELVSGGTHKSIHITLSNSWMQHLSFNSKTSESGVLLAIDIDRDNDLDLIWVSSSERSSPVVWLGDGHGNFELAQDPESYASALNSCFDGEDGAALSEHQGDGQPACTLTSSAAFDLELSHRLGIEFPPPLLTTGVTRDADLRLCSTDLRQRGPPRYFS